MPPPQDDIAFRSQEYASQVNRDVEPARQRMQGAVEGFARSVGQGVQMFQQGVQDRRRNALAERELMQRQQQIDLEKTASASALALQQTRQKQAEYELWFTQQLHNTKAIGHQQEQMRLQTELLAAQVQKAKRDSEGEWPRGISVEEMDYMISKGRKWDFRTRAFVEATPEEMAAAEQRSTSGIAQRRLEYQEAAEERKYKQGQEELELRRASDELDALTTRLKEAKLIRDKATREAKVDALIEELDAWSTRSKALGPTGENGKGPPSGNGTVGDKTYIDILRSIPGGR